jgi:hypothetical protein
MATDKAVATTDRLNRLTTYAAGLKQRLSGKPEKELKNVLEIDLRKTEAQIAKLKG